MNESELRNLMYTAQLETMQDPFVIRYPRGEGVMPEWKTAMKEIKIGTGRKLKEGKDIAILSLGHPGNFAAAAIRELKNDGLNPGHYDMRFAKPLDETLLHEACQHYSKLITVEDGTVEGGFGSAVLEFMAKHGYKNEVRILGIPDRLVEHSRIRLVLITFKHAQKMSPSVCMLFYCNWSLGTGCKNTGVSIFPGTISFCLLYT
jgi:1-deoxy-D-xylulose-5-phosphate synthase